MEHLQKRLLEEISAIPVIDPHSHIDPRAAASKTLDDLLGYHYFTELAHSAGMDAAAVQQSLPPGQRLRAIAEFLPRLENTVQYSWLLAIARDLFGFRGESVDADNIDELDQLARQKMAGADWEDEVLARSGIDVVFLTNDFDDPLTGFDTEWYVPCLRTDELVFKLGFPGVLDRLRKCSGVDVRDSAGLDKALAAVFDHFKAHGVRACVIGLPPDFTPGPVSRAVVEPLLARVFANQPLSQDECHRVRHYIFWTITQLCSDYQLPFYLMIGAVRDIYPAGVVKGRDLFDRRNSLAQYAALFNAFPRVKFPVSIIDSAGNPELVAFSWILPNVFPAGHWWYANIPALIDRDLRQRLAAVPRTKQIGYYSDMYKLEFGYPKFNMYRRVLARVLAEDFVRDRGWSEDKAIDLAKDLLRRNVERVFYGRED